MGTKDLIISSVLILFLGFVIVFTIDYSVKKQTLHLKNQIKKLEKKNTWEKKIVLNMLYDNRQFDAINFLKD